LTVENFDNLVFNCIWRLQRTTTAENLISVFDTLPEPEKREVATVILHRTLNFDLPPLSDDDLALNAEQLFLELDRREEEDAKS
jgi:hypothetical protein